MTHKLIKYSISNSHDIGIPLVLLNDEMIFWAFTGYTTVNFTLAVVSCIICCRAGIGFLTTITKLVHGMEWLTISRKL